MNGIHFEWTVSLGTVIHLIGLTGAILAVYLRLRQDVIELKTKVELLYRWWEQELERRHNPNA